MFVRRQYVDVAVRQYVEKGRRESPLAPATLNARTMRLV